MSRITDKRSSVEMNEAGDHADETETDRVAVRRSAMDLLARREHSSVELKRKLLRRYSLHLTQAVIEVLATEGLQSDERYVESYVRQRASRGYGPARIQRELQERGVDESLAVSMIAVARYDWQDIAQQALTKKFGVLSTPLSLAEKARILRFFAYRGFGRQHLPPLPS